MTRNRIGRLFALLGVVICLVELGLHWFCAFFCDSTYTIGGPVIGLGIVLGFVGFYIQDPAEAKDGGGFIADRFVQVLGAIPNPFGRRSYDKATAAAVAPAPPASPASHAVPAAPHVDHGEGDETGASSVDGDKP